MSTCLSTDLSVTIYLFLQRLLGKKPRLRTSDLPNLGLSLKISMICARIRIIYKLIRKFIRAMSNVPFKIRIHYLPRACKCLSSDSCTSYYHRSITYRSVMIYKNR